MVERTNFFGLQVKGVGREETKERKGKRGRQAGIRPNWIIYI
jgi:hypothetical protein